MPDDELPLPDYDHLAVSGLASRIRSLNAENLQTLLEYERGHANRRQVTVIMENRLESLKAGAQLSGGDGAPSGSRPGPTDNAPQGAEDAKA